MSKDYLKKDFWKNIHFERLVVWYGVNWKIIHFFRSIHSAKCAFFYSSISSNHPGAKSVVRRAFNSVLQTAATTLSFYSVFFFFGHTDRKIIWIFPYKPSPSRMEQTHIYVWLEKYSCICCICDRFGVMRRFALYFGAVHIWRWTKCRVTMHFQTLGVKMLAQNGYNCFHYMLLDMKIHLNKREQHCFPKM